MTVPANTVRRTKRWKAQIGADEYQGHTDNISITPTTATFQGGDGKDVVDNSDAQIVLSVAQDTENAASLWRVLHDRAGETATLTLFPHYDGDFNVVVETTLVRPPLTVQRGTDMPKVQVTLTGTYVEAPETP